MWPYPWTHVGTPSNPGQLDRVAVTLPSQAPAGAAQGAPEIGHWEGQDAPLVRPFSCLVKGGIPSSRRYLSTYLKVVANSSARSLPTCWLPKQFGTNAECPPSPGPHTPCLQPLAF